MMNKPINFLLIVLMGLAAAGLAYCLIQHNEHLKDDEATRFINQKLSERTRALEIERERLSRQIDSLESVEPVQLPPKIITVVKKVAPKDWWIASPTDTIKDSIFWYGLPVVDSLEGQY